MENSIENGLKGKKVLVIGGTGPIGSHVSQKFLSLGCAVSVICRKKPVDADLIFVECDFEKNGIDELCRPDVSKVLCETEVLVVCYGPFIHKSLEKTDATDWKNIALLDYALPGLALSLVLPGMISRGNGSVVFLGGTRTETIRPRAMTAAYHGAKTALGVLVESAASAYGDKGIFCNAVLPGFVSNIPHGMEGFAVSADDVAQVVVDLALNKSVNGVMVCVDKGWFPSKTF